MKRIAFFLMAMFAMVNNLSAQNATQDIITFGDVTIPQGGSAVLAVKLSNPDHSYAGVQCDFTLPAGVKATKISSANRVASVINPNTDKEAFNTEMADNTTFYRLMVYNSIKATIPESDGDIAYITVNADATAALGEYEGTITGRTMTTADGMEYMTKEVGTFKVTISNQWILDETSTSAPAASGKAVDILVNRTLKANQWSTICLPFDMTQEQVKEVFGNDVQIAFFDKDDKSTVKVTGNPVESIEVEFKSYDYPDAMLYGCTPYLIKVSKDIKKFETNAEIYIDEQYLTSAYTVGRGSSAKTYGFYGKLQAGTVIPENGLFLSGNEFWYSAGKTVMKGFRGYFQFTDVVPKSSSAKVTFNVDGEATSIDGMDIKYAVEGVYDLSGRKIQLKDGDLNKLQKGVYIIDGKKVTIK